ncbi:MAG: EAL domain-containing protein [Rhodoferax sp.]|nr:EAL domain-containing protein [Rhodoferax sp.]
MHAPRSLKLRLTLFTLVVFVVSIWTLTLYISRTLRDDMQAMLGEQQFSTVSLIADQINKELTDRFKGLELVASGLSPALLENPVQLQSFMEQRPLLNELFNGGVMVLQLDGTAAAETPSSAKRVGTNYLDIDTVGAALRNGKSTVGRPVFGKKLQAPVFGMTVPVRTPQGQVIGALSGVTNLSLPSFLDKIGQNHYGKSGGYVLFSPQDRLIVTATDKSLVMKELPKAGVNPLLDRRVAGFEGTAVHTNLLGIEVLGSAKKIPAGQWMLGVTLPTQEAFAPIAAMQKRMLLAAALLTLLAGTLTWWISWQMIRRQLAPIVDATRSLTTMTDTQQRVQPLPVTSQDEVGELVVGFNRLLESLGQREAQREEALARLHKIASRIPGVVFQFLRRPDGSACVPYASEVLKDIYRLTPQEVTDDASAIFSAVHPDDLAQHLASIETSAKNLTPWHNEYRLKFEGAPDLWLLGDAMPEREADGSVLWHGIVTNVTERKAVEADLRIAACAFESQEGLVVTDAQGVILRVNRAFSEITGYSAEESVGQTPSLMKSGRHDAEFYRAMWESIHSTGGWQGEVWDRRKNGEVYPKWLTISTIKNSQGLVTHYIGTHYDITERKQAEEKIKDLAFFDQLTGLANRTLLLDRLRQTMTANARSGHRGAILFIDLDKFKTLNDTLGHDMGDLLLQLVAQRLGACVRAEDTVARLGGDEFVVMLANLSPGEAEAATQAEAVGLKILDTLNEPYHLRDVVYRSTPSIGATLFDGVTTEVEVMLKQADLAMYKSKDAGRNALRFFDPDMERVVMKRAALEKDLHEAIESRQFLLHYQAQIAQGQLTGAEVLVRWLHPVRGMVSPADFIPLAEETGLILPLGQWMLETACLQLAQWATQPGMDHLTVAVNVSARQFSQSDFVDQVLGVVKTTDVNPQRLKLELTESMLVANVEEIIAKMLLLKANGIGFSLDDFGTGYSSLTYLKRLPLDQLKIDQSFVRDVLTDANEASIAQTIIALGKSLGLGVIAEGVETQDQQDFLAASGCHAYQGYFISRPLPIDRFEEFAHKLAA